ncbi:MAG TPA: hypothetical protein VMZ90_01375, partial [Vicinamibacterales bacterium]|nr:hypothetical protein [Vicinamibacterales bacterium]
QAVQQTVPKLHVQGTEFVDESGRTYHPRWVSGLTLLVRTPSQQATFLDWAKKTGFNGVRVFAGAVGWAKLTPEISLDALPGLLDRAARRGLVVEVTGLMDTATGYDAKAHLQALVKILSGRRGVVFELANEIGHPTQAKDLTPERLRLWGEELVAPSGLMWAVGPADTDQLVNGHYPSAGGSYITVHLDRGGAMWPQIARVRALFAIVEAHGVPVIDNEPMGADERPGRETGRQRWNDPAGFFALGVLDRAFNLGGIHHSQAGLMGEVPGPVQQRCADAYVTGHRVVESAFGADRFTFAEAGRDGSPVLSVAGMAAQQVLPFVAKDRAVVILVGAPTGARVQWAKGWRQVAVVKTMAGQDGARVDVIRAALR